MNAIMSFLFLIAVPSLYYWGVRRAIALRQQDMLLLFLLLMVMSLRASLSFAGVPALPFW